jgi:hypothetical protein
MRLPMLASMIHQWATIRGISFPVTSSLPLSLIAVTEFFFHMAFVRCKSRQPSCPYTSMSQTIIQFAGGELQSVGEATSEPFLKRWLRARSWDVDRAFGALIKHAEWRAANMPGGCVDKVNIML